jgi:MFS family permease
VVLVVMHLIYSLSAYPFGILADRLDRRLQIGLGVAILIGADVVLACATTFWLTALGAALWGLQMGITQGLLSASVADTAPDHLRGTAFGFFEVAIGVGTFIASAAVGAIWATAGPPFGFGFSALVAVGAAILLLLRSAAANPRHDRLTHRVATVGRAKVRLTDHTAREKQRTCRHRDIPASSSDCRNRENQG